MQKLKRFIITFLTVGTLSLLPVSVHAQQVVDVGSEDSSSVAAVPDTGTELCECGAMPVVVFLGGSLLGAGLGLTVVSFRKKHNQ